MSRKKNAVAEPERPQGGGSFIRDRKTGKLKRVEHTKPAEVVADRSLVASSFAMFESDPASPAGGETPNDTNEEA